MENTSFKRMHLKPQRDTFIGIITSVKYTNVLQCSMVSSTMHLILSEHRNALIDHVTDNACAFL